MQSRPSARWHTWTQDREVIEMGDKTRNNNAIKDTRKGIRE